MRVFVSWSGPRSQKVGEALSKFIRRVLQRTEPWYSKNSIRSGRLAYDELVKALIGTKFGILCVTADNWERPWLNFEAGALLRSVEATQVTPYLLDIKPSQLQAPLNLFQARAANQSDTLELCRDINTALGSDSLPPNELNDHFEKWWPELESQLNAIESTGAEPPKAPDEKQLILEMREMLSLALSQKRPEHPVVLLPDTVPKVAEETYLRMQIRQNERELKKHQNLLKEATDQEEADRARSKIYRSQQAIEHAQNRLNLINKGTLD
ncbi:hypothetical protein ETAA8_57400 [Anatilimnocola aggregata]|uniref:TIR domain-containing protein n=1 Tax=Anatilimnocola aggregata TaxID=2528021 RepID=A0A517YK47_9BACT|nr:TIR domain-containing protein [Anatilimnocola aggregata]QDU30594.1 hypothetical protein ETAA8_57400 [Anatilimnocola aggregata]